MRHLAIVAFSCALLAVWCAPVAGITQRFKVEGLDKAAFEIAKACANVAGNNPKTARAAILACTAEKQKKHPMMFPKEAFEILLDHVLVTDAEAKQFWSDCKSTDSSKNTDAKIKLDEALSAVPSDIISDPSKGNLLTSIKESLNANNVDFKTLFSKDYELNPENDQPIGDGKNSEGVVYSVQSVADKSKKYALKVIFATKEPIPPEFAVHKELTAEGRFKPAPAFPFIPQYVTSGRSKDKKFDFVIMELTGINLKQWFNWKETSLRPNPDEIKRMVARTYWILKAMHKAGYRHGDNHIRNWALSLTNRKVILLFDFGRTRTMKGDYTWMARDLYFWADMVHTYSYFLPADPDTPGRNGLTAKSESWMKELEEVLWRNPDNPVEQNAPYQELQAADHEAALKLPGLKEFVSGAEAYVKTIGEAKLEAEVDLYRWKSK